MIVRQFLHWLRTAPSGDRAEATSALARAFLYSDLSDNDRAAAEGAMIMLLDDPSPLVRRALAEVFAGSDCAPPTVVHALAQDQPDVAEPVLQRSPLLLDADLVEAVAGGEAARQIAIASRASLPCSVSAAIAEVGCAEACLTLLENEQAEIVAFSLDRDRAAIRASGRDPRHHLVARRPAGADPAGAGGQAVGDARRLRHRARMAPRRARPPRHPRGLREGDHYAGRLVRGRPRCAR